MAVTQINVHFLNQLEEIAGKHSDLFCNRLTKNVMEITGKSFYYDLKNPAPTMRIMATYDSEGMIALQLQCFNIEIKRLKFTGENIDEVENFIASLSFYGRRHYFCGGFNLDEENVAIGETAAVEYHHPYHHFRHKNCKMFYTKAKGGREPVITCPACSMYKSRRSSKSKKRKVSPDRRCDPMSFVPTCRLTEAEKSKRLTIIASDSKNNKQLHRRTKTTSDIFADELELLNYKFMS